MRDIFNTLNIKESAMGSFLMYFICLYLYCCILSLKDFKDLKFNYKDSVSILILVLLLGTICYSVLNLKLENLDLIFHCMLFLE